MIFHISLLKQPEPIVIPPLPDIVCGVKIDRLKQQAYQEGKFISIGICDPGGVMPINYAKDLNYTNQKSTERKSLLSVDLCLCQMF